jgi:hypothetical protein
MNTNGIIPQLRRDLSLEQITHEGRNQIYCIKIINEKII